MKIFGIAQKVIYIVIFLGGNEYRTSFKMDAEANIHLYINFYKEVPFYNRVIPAVILYEHDSCSSRRSSPLTLKGLW